MIHLLPKRMDLFPISKISKKEVSPFEQDPLDLSQKSVHGRVTVRRLNIDYGMETVVCKGQEFGIPGSKRKPANSIGIVAERHRMLGEVDTHQEALRNLRG